MILIARDKRTCNNEITDNEDWPVVMRVVGRISGQQFLCELIIAALVWSFVD